MPYQIPTAGIEDSAVNASKIATDAVGTTEIISDGVRTADIQNSAVTTAKINDSAVTTAKINDGSVTLAKLDPSINFFPSGGIIMWSGATDDIPTGWVICDGQNGTPDLRNRFIVGATAGTGSIAYPGLSPNATGGSADAIVVEHTHTGSTSPVGDHSHGYNNNQGTGGGQGGGGADTGSSGKTTGGGGAHNHTLTVDSTGSSGTNANLPPYMALAYIMKT